MLRSPTIADAGGERYFRLIAWNPRWTAERSILMTDGWRSRRLGMPMLLSVLAVAVVGCGEGPGIGDDPAADDGTVAVYDPTGPGGDAALLGGELRDEGGCLVVLSDEGEVVIPVFPRGRAAWDGESLSIDGATVRPGERLDLGGGYRDEWPGAAEIASACPEDVLFFQVAN